MASNVTPEFGLNQWSLEDNFVMEEFNTDNRKIEQALLETKEAARPKFKSGSYEGTGNYGADEPSFLTFDFEPQLVILVQEDSLSANVAPIVCIRGVPQMMIAYDSASDPDFRAVKFNMIWDGNTFRWYSQSPIAQFSLSNVTYHYMAIG